MAVVIININDMVSEMKAKVQNKAGMFLTWYQLSEMMQYMGGLQNSVGGAISYPNVRHTRSAADASADTTFCTTAAAKAYLG